MNNLVDEKEVERSATIAVEPYTDTVLAIVHIDWIRNHVSGLGAVELVNTARKKIRQQQRDVVCFVHG